jgi:hypothetical protein
MPFWNKLSTAALMRLTILASLNLLLGRLVGRWDILLHPLFFLIIVTLNLGLYAVMVYSGTLNLTLIGMMLGGLAATLWIIAYTGIGPRAFMYGGPSAQIRLLVESILTRVLEVLRDQAKPPRWQTPDLPGLLNGEKLVLIGYLVIDTAGLILIGAGGWSAPHLRKRMEGRNATTARPSS